MAQQGQREQGVVKCWYVERGFGFVTRGKGQDLFVHWQNIQAETRFRKLREGQIVSFAPAKTERGWAALDVIVECEPEQA